ncbi:methylated-DNA--protein-cysteine methyltransferase [Actinobacillus seminis]|uniref:Methylated-DNA--protein-cysteine methyltransferase n=1 Tax=Actinobacillus seminis TaxID=722 RepID=A0A380V8M1_9PAST|nr:methylated-DNA--protein-cysteine methyltransferase [Actinobacillus seminis]
MTTIYYCYYSSPIGKLLMPTQQDQLTNLDLMQKLTALL